MSRFQNSLYFLMYALFAAMGRIPRRWAYPVADGLGTIAYLIDKRHRKVALDNLKQAFSYEKKAQEIRAIARNVFKHLARIPFEIGWSLQMNTHEFTHHCIVTGRSNLRDAYAKGQGVLILGGHIGNWELLPIVIMASGFPVSFIYRPLDFAPADRFLFQYRSRSGGKPIPRKGAMRKILSPLRKKECVGILLDQDSGHTAGIFADFFGRPACTNKGLALLALKTKSPVVPVFVAREGFKFKVEIGREIPLIQTGQKEHDIQANTLQYNQAIEAFIRRYPEQWLWVHRRWKNEPRDP